MISPLLLRPWGQAGCQKKQKPSRNSNFEVWTAVFQPKLNKLRKNAQKQWFLVEFLDVFEDSSVLTEKQRPKPKNSSSLKVFASFDTLLDPRGTKVVEKSQFIHFVLKFDDSGAL